MKHLIMLVGHVFGSVRIVIVVMEIVTVIATLLEY